MLYILMIIQVLGYGTNPAPASVAVPEPVMNVIDLPTIVWRAETIDSFERTVIAPWTTRGGTFYWTIRDTTNVYGPNTVNQVGYRYCGIPPVDVAEYPNGSDSASLVSPTINLAGWDSFFVSFAYWADVEGSTDNFDGFEVEISPDNGTTWLQVDSNAVGHLNPTYDSRLCNTGPLGYDWAYCYDKQYWVNVASQNLIALGYVNTGQQIKVRFKFAKDPLSGGQGVFIDDVRFGDVPPPDQQAPVFVHSPLQDNPDTLAPSYVYAEITDVGSGVNSDSVFLHYKIENGSWNRIQMTHTGGDSYEAYIPAQPYHTDIFYYLTALDNANPPNQGITPTYNFEVTSALTIQLDDGQPYWGGNIGANNGLFTQFPLIAVGLDSGRLHQVKFFFDGPGPFDCRIYSWGGSMPGQLIDSIAGIQCPEYMWYTVDLDPLNIHAIGEVVVGYVVRPHPTDSIFCMLDPTQDYPERLWGLINGAWQQTAMTGGDMMCRLKVIPLPEFSVEEKPGSTPRAVALGPAVPNPAHRRTTLSFQLPKEQAVRLELYSVTGQLVQTLADGRYPAGTHQVVWNGQDHKGRAAASGVYFIRLKTEERTLAGKLIVTK